jgi:hypothetical protein
MYTTYQVLTSSSLCAIPVFEKNSCNGNIDASAICPKEEGKAIMGKTDPRFKHCTKFNLAHEPCRYHASIHGTPQ